MINCNQPVFIKEWYINALKQGPKELFNRIKLDLKWAYQRVQRGYSDYDVGDIDIWFEYVMPGILETLKSKELPSEYPIGAIDEVFYRKVFKENNISEEDYRAWNTEKVSEETLNKISLEFHNYWVGIIDKMIFLLTEMNEDECSKKDELNNEELNKYCDQKRKEAFEMLNKYFHYLWY